MATCKNCGAEFDSNFCPDCGQKATAGERFTLKAFSKHSLLNFARLNDGFIHTALGLVEHPWIVISDYIHGKRARYSPPITMLIQVILYTSVLVYFVEKISGIELEFNDTPYVSIEADNWFVDYVLSSDIFQDVMIIIPFSLAGMIAFRWVGGRKYNAAEYLVAGTYMMCLNFILDFLIVPVQLLSHGQTFGIPQFAMLFFTLATLWKAFRVKEWWKEVLSIIFYVIVALVFFIAELALLAGIALPFAYHSGVFTIGFNLH